MDNLYNFLNNETNRKLKFIEILHRQDEWVTLSVITKELDCSDKVLRNDIKQINLDFAPFMIISSPKGVVLEYPPTINIEFIYSEILKNSIEYQIIENVFFKPKISITELSEIIYSSETGIRRKIKELSSKTEQSGFRIEITGGQCNIVGEEVQIRNFLSHYFFEKMYYDEAPFDSTEYQVVGTLIDYVEKGTYGNYGMDIRREVINYLLISLKRVSAGSFLLTEKRKSKVHRSISFKEIIANTFFQREFFHVFKMKLNQSLLEELTCVFVTYEFSLPKRGLKFNEDIFFPTIKTNIGEQIIRMSKDLEIPIYNIDGILNRVFVDLAIYVGPLFVLHDRNKLFVSRLERSYPNFIQHLKQVIASFSKKHDIEFEESLLNQIIFSIMVEWHGILTYLENYRAKVKIALLVDSSPSHANYLAELIEHQVGGKLNVTHVFNQKTKKQQQEIANCQLLITTISEYDVHGVLSICIDRNPSLNDLKEIQSLVETISQEEFNNRLN